MFDLPSRDSEKRGPRASRANLSEPIRQPVQIELSEAVFETLRQDGEFTLSRGRRHGSRSAILAVASAAEYLGAEST